MATRACMSSTGEKKSPGGSLEGVDALGSDPRGVGIFLLRAQLSNTSRLGFTSIAAGALVGILREHRTCCPDNSERNG